MSRRRIFLGLVAAAVYVAAAVGLAGDAPVLPLYDGNLLPPEPYRWVSPPPDSAATNVTPEPARQEVALTETGSVSGSIVTSDSQVALVVRDGSFAARLGEIAVIVEITPLDPATIGPPPMKVRYDGNAYRITARYAKSGADAPLANPGTVVLRSPLGGTRLLRRQDPSWTEISAQPVAASLQVFAETTDLGTFVAGQTIHAIPSSFPWLPVSLGAAGVAAIAAWFSAAHIRRGRKAPPRRDRRAAMKGKPPPRPAPRRRKRR